MAVMLMNSNNNINNKNNNKQYFHLKKQALIKSKSVCPSIFKCKTTKYIQAHELTLKLE